MHSFFQTNFQAFVHRGNSIKFTENTYESFQEAINIGYKYIETDLRITSDNKIITFHDQNLKRICGVEKDINNLTYKEISQLDLYKGGTIPELSHILESFPNIRFNIDFKSEETLHKTLDILDSHMAYDRVCLASFDSQILKKAKTLRPNSCVSMGMLDTFLFKLFNKNQYNFDCIQIPIKWKGIKLLTKKVIKKAHNNGMKVNIWTVNDEDEMIKLIEMGVDGIMTDDALLLKKVSQKFNLF